VVSSASDSTSSTSASSTSEEEPPIYPDPTSSCLTPSGQFVIQLRKTNLYITGQDGGAVPNDNVDVKLVATSNLSNAISFTAAEDGNGQITLITADGSTLLCDQDRAGNSPIYWGKSFGGVREA
jgi:hypothetical protein